MDNTNNHVDTDDDVQEPFVDEKVADTEPTEEIIEVIETTPRKSIEQKPISFLKTSSSQIVVKKQKRPNVIKLSTLIYVLRNEAYLSPLMRFLSSSSYVITLT